jgi:N-acetylglucosamine kinase-like BadF-type ATPase
MPDDYLIALEGGGSHSQAVVMATSGQVLHVSDATGVNTNFVSFQEAQQAVWQAVTGALESAGVPGENVRLFVSALVGPRFGPELFGSLLPNANYRYYGERDVIFAQAGIYIPHGVAVVAATGATAWAVRADDGRQVFMGGWGTLLGDEGSAYAAGLLGLRAAIRAFEGREAPTGLLDAVCQYFAIKKENFRQDIVRLAYHKPLSRAEIAGLAVQVTRLAADGDAVAGRIMAKAASDLTALALHAARRLFQADDEFPLAAAGGFFKAGEMLLKPLRDGLARDFPRARLVLGTVAPAIALGRRAIDDLIHNRRNHAN